MSSFAGFLKQFRTKTYAKGEIVLVEGELPPAAYVIKRGVIKVYNLTNEGQEKPIEFEGKLEIFPIGWVFGHIHRTQYFYEAFTATEVYVVPREDYLKYLQQQTTMLFSQYKEFIRNYLNFQMRVYALEQSKASEKIIHTLHFFCLKFGRTIRKNVVRIDLPLTQQDMANFMGLTRETTGIELKRLERNGTIDYKRQNYIVHIDKLSSLLDEEYHMQLVK